MEPGSVSRERTMYTGWPAILKVCRRSSMLRWVARWPISWTVIMMSASCDVGWS
jgi:hypothetical protein